MGTLLQKFRTRGHNRRKPKGLFPASRHIIDYAFTVAGVDYYRHDDIFNLPFERGFMALAAYEECRMGVNREYLDAHTTKVRELLTAPKVNIFEIHKLNEQLKERMLFVADADLLYKLASVVFFDKNENPSLYEIDYNKKKIEFWKRHKGVADFFLQKPLKELIPFLSISETDLRASLEVSEKIRRLQTETPEVSPPPASKK
ncbi:MAG: hypothetical protein LBS43_09215 [Prevotellaceae bacterium]|jgi:hypothetical protein|nr:hypothetical protein [Prevotellaceae bacterium]